MSIIQEALKKAEEKTAERPQERKVERPVEPSVDAVVARKPPAAGAVRRSPDPRFAAALVLALVLALAFLPKAAMLRKAQQSGKASVEASSGRTSEPADIGTDSRPGASTQADRTVTSAQQSAEPSTDGSVESAIAPQQSAPTMRLEHRDYVLNGIMYLEGAPRAIINNAMVEEGDTVDGAKVVKIEKRTVVLQQNGYDINLNIK
jgi:hypothetical protein